MKKAPADISQQTTRQGQEPYESSASSGPRSEQWPALRNLSYRINFIHRLFDRQTKKFLSETHGLTNAEWYVLAYLAWHSPRTIAAISTDLAIYKSQVSHAVTSLVGKRLVLRTDDPVDRRSPRFRISKRGLQMQARISQWAAARQKQFAAQLPAAHYQVLDEALNMLASYAKSTA
jgi:DNA-binding MarR family transcriptional regulator